MKKTQFSASTKLLDWLAMQSERWGLKRAATIRLILDRRAEKYPEGERHRPTRGKP